MLGGVDLDFAFAIPWNIIHSVRKYLNTTTTSRGTYWHIHVSEEAPNKFALQLAKNSENLDLDQYRIALLSAADHEGISIGQ